MSENKLFKLTGQATQKIPDTVQTVPAITETQCVDTVITTVIPASVTSLDVLTTPVQNAGQFNANISPTQTSRIVDTGNGGFAITDFIFQYTNPTIESTTTTVCTTTTEPAYDRVIQHGDVVVDAPIHGWNGSALSGEKISSDGEFTFYVPSPTVGAVVGMNQFQGFDNFGYQDIDFGFVFTRGNVSILENGVHRKSVGAGYSETDSFTIRRVNGVVTYLKNDLLIYRSLVSSNELLYLDASLYLSDDTILNAEFQPLTADLTTSHKYGLPANGADYSVIQFNSSSAMGIAYYSVNDAVIVPHQTFDSTSTFTELRTSILGVESFDSTSSFSAEGDTGNQSVSVMEPLGGYASEHSGGVSVNAFTALDGQGYEGLISISLGIASSSMVPLTSQARVLTGGIATAQLQTMAGFKSTAADHLYSESINEMVDLRGIAGVFPAQKVGAAKLYDTLTQAQGSSILLPTGRHLLTAAHVVQDWADLNAVRVDFITDDGVTLPSYSPYRVTMHPDFDPTLVSGHPDFGKNDLAIVELTQFVDPIVKRHGIYAGADEADKIYDRTSYSPRVNPNSGSLTGTEGWDLTHNKIDAGDAYFLFSDFDSGLAETNVIGSTGLSNEGGVSSGDSGSAILVDDIIYGILATTTSFVGKDVTNSPDGSYGELISDVRVSSYTNWIIANSVTTTPYHQPNPFIPDDFSIARAANCIVDVEMPEFELEVRASPVALTGVTIPLFDLEVESVSGSVAELEIFDLEIEAEAELLILTVADLELFGLDVEATAIPGSYATADFEFPIELEVEAYTGAVVDLELIEFDAEAQGTSTAVAKVDIELFELVTDIAVEQAAAVSVVDIEIFDLETFYGSLDALMFDLDIEASGATLVATSSQRTYAVNTSLAELTEYTNYPFHNIVNLEGKQYGVLADGLYLLEGVNDNGKNIDAVFKTADMDFDTAKHKRVPYAYLDTTDATMIKPFAETTEVGQFSSNFKERRTRLARGARGRYWSFEVSNVNGEPLDLRSLELFTNTVRRKV